MSGYIFISYSGVDAKEFAFKLADELEGGDERFIATWIDKRNLIPGRDWDEQIVEAIKLCKCMLFIMTMDSVSDGSICKKEWTWAIKYKKDVIPVQLDPNAEQPFGLSNRQRIDFSENFFHGLAKLRRYLRHLESPEGILDGYKTRLADAKRDLCRSKGEKQSRIKADIEELQNQIKYQQLILENPVGVLNRNKKNIEDNLLIEKNSKKNISNVGIKFINPPPVIAPNYFQNRYIETKQIIDFLFDDAQRMMTVIGRGGVGKTAMTCRLLKSLEKGELPDGFGKVEIKGIIYLSGNGNYRATFTKIFYDLCKLLCEDLFYELDSLYKNALISSGIKMQILLEKFHDGKVVLLLDNFEPLVDITSQKIIDSELEEALRAIICGPHHNVKVLITTRIAPRDLNFCDPGRQRILNIDEGLNSPFAENILREMDVDGRLGLKSASTTELKLAQIKTRGFPRALEALFAILASDRYSTLEDVLAMPLPENVIEALVGEAYNRLDKNEKMVMKALAIYNRPVSSVAVDYLIIPYTYGKDCLSILQRLANMHFVRKENKLFYLHPIDRDYVYKLIPEKYTTFIDNDMSRYDMSLKAAEYYVKTRKNRDEWKELDDLSAQLAEYELRCNVGDYDTAAEVLNEIGFDCLVLWGHWNLLIKMCDLLENIEVYENKQTLFYNLSSAYRNAGDTQLAIHYTEQALVLARKENNLNDIARFCWSHGVSYTNLGEIKIAIKYCKEALEIFIKINDDFKEAGIRCSLANCYLYKGSFDMAIKNNKYALDIAVRNKYKRFIAESMFNLGNCYSDIDESKIAIDYYMQSIGFADELGLIFVQVKARYGLACEYLFSGKYSEAKAAIDDAIVFDYPRSNHDLLVVMGIICLCKKDYNTANYYFEGAICQAELILKKTPRFYRALYAKVISYAGLSACVCDVDVNDAADYEIKAKEAYLHAIKVCATKGVLKRFNKIFNEVNLISKGEIMKNIINK